MNGDFSMPQGFREDFHRAIVKTFDWITRGGGPEPESDLQGKSLSLGTFFDLMTKFDQDHLSEIDRAIVLQIMGGARSDECADIERNPSCGNAAKHLVRRIGERRDELERRRK